MNVVTRDIAAKLKIDLEVSLKIQDAMECDGFDFSEATYRAIFKEAKYQYSLMN
jgi:hypothetical protein